MQTLSQINRAYSGKNTTHVLDFVNDLQKALKAFKTYHTTATLESTTDPDLALELRAKLDATVYYDDNNLERVVRAELDIPQTQSKLVAAIPTELMNAIIGAFEAHSKTSTQALNSEKVRRGLLDILLGPARLYEELRQQDGGEAA